jgi:hypothetical protein
MYGKFKRDSARPFLERIRQWVKQSEKRKQVLIRTEKRREVEGCTFEPQLNSRSKYILAHKDARALTLSKLSRAAKRRYEHIIQSREDDYLSNCTFKPQLNQKSLKMAESARLSITSFKKAREHPSPTDRRVDLQECTFRPRVKGVKKQMALAMKYCQRDLYERLVSKTTEFSQTKLKNMTDEQKAEHKKINLREFFERQNLMILRKERRLKELTNEIYRYEGFTANHKSQLLSQIRRQSFHARQVEVLQRKQKRVRKIR